MKEQLPQKQSQQQKIDCSSTISRPDSPFKLNSFESRVNPFYTEIKIISEQQQGLQTYISDLRKQIKNAVWKQDLVLQYNYMPLQQIKEKIKFQKQAYLLKMNSFKEQYLKMFQNSQFTQQLQNLRNFNLKLKQKMKDYELKLQQINVKNALTRADAEKKKERLKQLIKSNMDLSKKYAQRLGATRKQDIVRLVKAKSEITLHKQLSLLETAMTQRKSSILKRSEKSAKFVKKVLQKTLFEECFQKITGEIKYMNTISDIQSGIYLEIMNKKTNQYSNAGKISHFSTINNTLHQRYASKVHKRGNKHFEENDFEIDWETFRNMNWKQILGVLMMKDKKCQKLKNSFKKIQFQGLSG